MIQPDSDFREVLKLALAERGRARAQYSMRAFARELGMSSSRLSDILSGKIGLSSPAAREIGRKIGLNANEVELFALIVEAEHARSSAGRELAKARLQKLKAESRYESLKMDIFDVVSDWYHFAILELLQTSDFSPDPRWIAKRLQISVVEAQTALKRLKRLGIIEQHGRQICKVREVTSPDGIPSAAIRKFHKQILDKATTALETQSLDERDFSAILMPFDSRLMQETKDAMTRFRRRVRQSSLMSENKQNVYCLSMQFFKLTQPEPSDA